MSGPHDITIRVQVLEGQWEVLGADRLRGVVPENVQLTANEWGPDTCSFSLRGAADVIRNDLAAWTPIEVDVAGVTVWDGRIKETPTQDGAAGRIISVQAEGWQYHLDDDAYDRMYVHNRLGDWKDIRSSVVADLTRYTTSWNVNVGDGGIAFGVQDKGAISFPRGGTYFDGGSAGAIQRVVVNWEKNQWASDNFAFLIWGDNIATLLAGATVAMSNIISLASATNSGTHAVTIGGARYVALCCDTNTSQTADRFFRANAVRMFADTAYESGNVSTLTADDVVTDAIDQATLLLSADHSQVQAGTFVIDEYAPSGARSPREAISSINAYENYDTRIEVGRRPVFRPRPTAAIYEIGEWAGADFQDASVNSGQDIYNRVLVQGTGPDGAALTIERTTTGTMADRRNFRRTTILPISSSITTAVGQRFGDLFLAAHATTPFRGGFQTVGQGGLRRVIGGDSPHPAWLLRDTTQLVRCPVVDTDTGDWTRDARMVTVTYDHDALAATISLDEDREGFDALVARFVLAVGG